MVPRTINNGRINNYYWYEVTEHGDHFAHQEPYRDFDMDITCDSGFATNGQPMCQPDGIWDPEPGCSKGGCHVFYQCHYSSNILTTIYFDLSFVYME